MPIQIGYIDNNGHPKIRILVQGTNPEAAIEIDAMIDTGFTGFLMLPIAQALPLGLILAGTGDYILADGSVITNYLAKGRVTVRPSLYLSVAAKELAMSDADHEITAAETVEGLIVLAGDETLIGMESLTSLDKFLIVGKIVVLLDNHMIKELVSPFKLDDLRSRSRLRDNRQSFHGGD